MPCCLVLLLALHTCRHCCHHLLLLLLLVPMLSMRMPLLLPPPQHPCHRASGALGRALQARLSAQSNGPTAVPIPFRQNILGAAVLVRQHAAGCLPQYGHVAGASSHACMHVTHQQCQGQRPTSSRVPQTARMRRSFELLEPQGMCWARSVEEAFQRLGDRELRTPIGHRTGSAIRNQAVTGPASRLWDRMEVHRWLRPGRAISSTRPYSCMTRATADEDTSLFILRRRLFTSQQSRSVSTPGSTASNTLSLFIHLSMFARLAKKRHSISELV